MSNHAIGAAAVACTAAVITCLTPAVAGAETLAAGSLDPSFGSGGVGEELRPNAKESIWGRDVVVQPDGRIMVLSTETGRLPYLMVRYNADGTVDRTFGSEGEAWTPPRSQNGTRPPVLATQLVGGASRTLVHVDGDILRYDETGQLDTGFGTAGAAWMPYQGWPRDIEVSPAQDRILALADPGKMGLSLVYSGYQAQPQAVYAFTGDGRPDPSFGVGGMTLIGEAFLNPTGFKDLALQPDGKIVLSGGWLTARLHPNGELDDTFGDRGLVVDTMDYRWNQRVELDAEGRILVMRCHHSNSEIWGEINGGCLLVRYLQDGSRDLTYGRSGTAELTPQSTENVEIDSQGRAVAFGRTSEGANNTVLRLLPDGSRDASFGQDGLVTTSAPCGGCVISTRGALQPDDKPVRVGTLSDYVQWENELKIWRYLAAPDEGHDPDVGQSEGRLVGRVSDAKTGDALPGASIDCGDGRTVTADDTGGYSILLPVGTQTCSAVADGYRSSKARIDVPATGATHDFALRRGR